MKKPEFYFMKSVEIKEYKKKVNKKALKSQIITNENIHRMDMFDDYYEENQKGQTKTELDISSVVTDNNIQDDMFSDDYYGDSAATSYAPKSEVEIMQDSVFSDDYYEDNGRVTVRNIDDIERIVIDEKHRVTLEEAKLNIDTKAPFIVGKMISDKNKVEEEDIIYLTIPKIYFNESVRRAGYLEVAKKNKTKHINFEKSKNVVGLINDEYVVTKKKGFNQQRIGYVKIKDDNSGISRYIEITKSRGTRPLVLGVKRIWQRLKTLAIWALLIGAILFALQIGLPDGWHFDPSTLTLYKTQEQVEYNSNIVEIKYNASPELKDGKLKIELTSDKYVEDTKNELFIIIEIEDAETQEVIYKSKMLKAGTSLETVEIDKSYEKGEYPCNITCKTYRNSILNFVGTLESDFTMIVGE